VKDKVMYVCDPKKHTTCRKLMCGVCKDTAHRECAVTDSAGMPVVSPRWKEWQRKKKVQQKLKKEGR